jgi:hypothetical protein
VTGTETTVVNTLWLIIELHADGHHFKALDEWLLGGWGTNWHRIIFELEEASDEVQRVLVDV